MDFENSWINSIELKLDDSFKTKTLKELKSAERRHFMTYKFIIILLCMAVIILVSLIRKNMIDYFFINFEQCKAEDIVL